MPLKLKKWPITFLHAFKMRSSLFGHFADASQARQRLFSPVDGTVIPLEKVADPIFAQGTLGRGFAVEPTAGLLYAPVLGQVTLIATTQHAIILHQANGLDIMLHFGLNTAPLHGDPFRIHLRDGQQVRGGQRIGFMNRSKIKAAGQQPTVVVVITNTAEALDRLTVDFGPTIGGRPVGELVARS